MPRFAIGQADSRPSITIAVQKVTNSNTLDVLREQSNVGERVFFSSIWEGADRHELARRPQRPVPGLATEWRRIDDQTVELKLRQGVKFHNGDEMTAEDVVFSFGRERMFANTEAKNRTTIKAFEQHSDAARRQGAAGGSAGRRAPRRGPTCSASRPSTNTRCASSTRRPT